MREKFLRWQAVVYGRFNFDPTPKITVALTSAFAPLGFLPMVVNQSSDSGNPIKKISLNKDSIQIVFGKDRIDMVELLPADEATLEETLEKIELYLSTIPTENLQFNRIALVKEIIFQELTDDQLNANQLEYLPWSKPGSVEWSARSINNEEVGNEKINVCFDAIRLKGLALANGRMENLDGIKILHDISTDADEDEFRFNLTNIIAGFDMLRKVIDEQSVKFTVS